MSKQVTVVMVMSADKLRFVKEQTELRAEAYRNRATEQLAASNQLEHDRLRLMADWMQGLANQLIALNPKSMPDLYERFMRHAEIHIER